VRKINLVKKDRELRTIRFGLVLNDSGKNELLIKLSFRYRKRTRTTICSVPFEDDFFF